jgi:hypothetical protein
MTRVTFDVEKPIYKALKVKCLETEESIRAYLTRLIMEDVGLKKERELYTEEEVDTILAPYLLQTVKEYEAGTLEVEAIELDELHKFK